MKKVVFYHAGCSVCVSAEKDIFGLIPEKQVEVINLNEDKTKIVDAVNIGVKSVPALVLPNGNVLHINYGASIDDLK